MIIEKRAEYLFEDIKDICSEIGKNPEELIVVVATKSQNLESIKKVQNIGIEHFGENFLQEAESKILNLNPSPTWHFIGSIQSRKAKRISALFEWVQTLDRLKVAEKLNINRSEEQGKLNVCIQVNPENENNKSGISLEGCENFISQLEELNMLRVRGLMAIPKQTNNFIQQRKVFAKIRKCFDKLKAVYPKLDTLSMGMSGDYKAAILEGATMIRIGTGVFGERE